MNAPKVWKVPAHGKNGNGYLEAEQLATFAEYIDGYQYRFLVLKFENDPVLSVTERRTLQRVAGLPALSGGLRGDALVEDARVHVRALVARHGPKRVRAVIDGAPDAEPESERPASDYFEKLDTKSWK